MLCVDPITADSLQWQTWVVLIAGLAVAGLVFIGGVSLFRWFTPAGVAPATDGAPRERRRWLRKRATLAGVFIGDANMMTIPRRALVLDRSAGGLRLSVDAPISPGSIISVRSPNSKAEGVWLQVKVVRCKALERGWEIGCAFLEKPAGEQ